MKQVPALIIFEGLDGCGKTTQIAKLLWAWKFKVFYLDISLEEREKRLNENGNKDRMEGKLIKYYERVLSGYRSMSKLYCWDIIDSSNSIEINAHLIVKRFHDYYEFLQSIY